MRKKQSPASAKDQWRAEAVSLTAMEEKPNEVSTDHASDNGRSSGRNFVLPTAF